MNTPSEKLEKETPETLEAYRQGAETLMRIKSDQWISNALPSHAAILFEIFFKEAKKKVRMFCKNLNKAVFENNAVLKAAQDAANRGVEIIVLLQDSAPEDSMFSKWVKETRGNVKLLTATGSAKDAPVNFTVVDDYALRYEEDRDKCAAWASMNKPDIAQAFAKKFDQLIAVSAAQ